MSLSSASGERLEWICGQKQIVCPLSQKAAMLLPVQPVVSLSVLYLYLFLGDSHLTFSAAASASMNNKIFLRWAIKKLIAYCLLLIVRLWPHAMPTWPRQFRGIQGKFHLRKAKTIEKPFSAQSNFIVCREIQLASFDFCFPKQKMTLS